MAKQSNLLDDSILQEQIDFETEAVSRGVARYHKLRREAEKRGDASGLKPVERLLLFWFEPVVDAIRKEQFACQSGDPGVGRAVYGPVIRCLDAERLAVITLHEMLGLTICEPTGVKAVSLTYAVGSGVIAEIHWDMLKIEAKATLDELTKKFKRLTTTRRNWWAKQNLTEHLWNRRVCTHLGARLVQIAIENSVCEVKHYGKDSTYDPAFRKSRVAINGGKKMSGVIALTDIARSVIDEGHVAREAIRPRYLPMLVQPYPWSKEHEGGYIQIRTPFISKPTTEQSLAITEADMPLIYKSVNNLGSVAWRVNGKQLVHLNREWDDGGNSGGLPPRDNRPMPIKPLDIDINSEALKAWKADATAIHQENHRAMSRRVEFMSTLATAEAVKDRPFWLPHQMCWRSRGYPIPVHLNHHGSDTPRSLMLFDKAVELTDEGWRQIQIHTANKFGMDKLSFNDRVQWCEDNMDLIIHTARDPWNNRWWTEADDPQQFLASCMAQEDPEIGMRLPVQADGTCNGLQHYAGISLNESDAKAVNLCYSDTPSDVYTEVLHVVVDIIRSEFGKHNGMPELAVQYLNRKIIKQPVMTTVYGVTRIGARAQLQSKIRDVPQLNSKQHFMLSEYLSHRVLSGLGKVCVGAGEIMDWVRETARIILKKYPKEILRWDTSIGFPVIQPYRNYRSHRITTCLQEITYSSHAKDLPAMLRKQIQGAPANWIHSEDGTHMHNTNIRCYDEGIDFAEVHDSYWAHASNMDRVHVILREEFVSLHRESRAVALYNQWRELYPLAEIAPPPPRGNFDISKVLESPYFFS